MKNNLKDLFKNTLTDIEKVLAEQVKELRLIPSISQISQRFKITTNSAAKVINAAYPWYFELMNEVEHEDDFRENDKEYDVTRMGDLPKKSFDLDLFEYVEQFCINAKRANIEVILDTQRYTTILRNTLKTYAEYGFIYQYQHQQLISAKAEINKMLQDEELIQFLVLNKDNIFDEDYVTDYKTKTDNHLFSVELQDIEEPYYEDRGEHNEDELVYA